MKPSTSPILRFNVIIAIISVGDITCANCGFVSILSKRGLIAKENNDKQVKNYDFKRPAKFSKEHLRTLEIIFEHYGRLVSTTLPVYLRKAVQVTVASSETVTFSEFTNALANPVALGIVNFQPLGGTVIVELAATLAFTIIDRMLGGSGEPLPKNREFSEIEMSIVEKIMVICIQLLREPWKNVAEINPLLERIETNPQFEMLFGEFCRSLKVIILDLLIIILLGIIYIQFAGT